MPWVRAELRGQLVYARANEQGQLVAEGGRVEIRYKPMDGRMYRAAAANLTISDASVLPDDACGEAEPVERAPKPTKKGGRTKAQPPKEAAEGEIVAYTDGACSGNPGPAGLGVVVVDGERRIERYEYLGVATNNVAELSAVLRALEEIAEGQRATIYTDSQYTIGVAQKGWKAKANAELVAELRAALRRNARVRLVYVKGHAGIELNERADELARRAIEERDTARNDVSEPT